MPTLKLLPCPFCGSEVKLVHTNPIGWKVEWGVYCKVCGTHWDCDAGLRHEPKGSVAKIWNRRAHAPVMQGSECRYSDGAGGCRISPLVPPSETPCEHADNPARCRLYKTEGGQP